MVCAEFVRYQLKLSVLGMRQGINAADYHQVDHMLIDDYILSS